MPKPLPLLDDTAPLCCAPLDDTAGTISAEDAVALARRLKALADPSRLRLVSMMLRRPDHEACTCDIAPFVQLSEPTVSHHLKQLYDAGLVTKERRGMNVYYRVVPGAVKAVADVLTLDCC
jgi:ArsR family transcriptional regulator, arsenate/arsenite/antimonite-responsive transcriptional repressor